MNRRQTQLCICLLNFTAAVHCVALDPPASQPAIPTDQLNLGFERGETGQVPDGWAGGGEGYKITISNTEPHGGRQCASIRTASKENDAAGFVTLKREVPPDSVLGRRVRLRGYLRPTGITSGLAMLWMRANAADGKVLAFDNTQSNPVRGTSDWREREIVLDMPPKAAKVWIGALLSGNGHLDIDDLSLEVVSTSVPVSTKVIPAPEPGLFELRGEYELTATSSFAAAFEQDKYSATILLPMPICYREQIPLTYELIADPSVDISEIRIYEDKPDNFVAEVKLNPELPAGKLALRWRSIVLCGPRSFDDAPKSAPFPKEWPEEVRPWLRSTLAAQSDDERFRKIATEIRGDSNDVMTIIAKTIKRAEQIASKQTGVCDSLDAVQALTRRGSCTSAANLMAALLRANNIPARILAGYPSWFGSLQTHYIVEAYVPGYSWYPIESTRLRAPWQPFEQLEVAIIPPEYEDRCKGRFNICAGVPYLSLSECPDYAEDFTMVGIVNRENGSDHIATRIHGLPADRADDWQKAEAAGRKRWKAWLAKAIATQHKSCVSTPLTAADLRQTADFPALMAKLQP